MMANRNPRFILGVMMLAALAGLPVVRSSVAQLAFGTAFTFQGSLKDGGVRANGAFDFQFNIFDVDQFGTPLAPAVELTDVDVIDGIFSVSLDFGTGIFTGDPRFIEIGVRPGGGGGGPFTPLFPRQALTPAPYSLFAASADTARSADTATSATTATMADMANTATSAITAATAGNADLLDGLDSTAFAALGDILTTVLANDGAGSGLDADLLDGLDSGAFAALGDILPTVLANDGPGSGLNADFVDGNDSITLQVPTGTILPFVGFVIPPGYVLCDGRTLNRTTDATLFNSIMIRFGQGDGVNTFNVPDLRGRFLRMRDRGTGRDPDAGSRTASALGGATGDNVGSLQGDATAMPFSAFGIALDGAHSHKSRISVGGGAVSTVDFMTSQNGVFDFPRTETEPDHTHTITGGDAETRPTNLYVDYIIKR